MSTPDLNPEHAAISVYNFDRVAAEYEATRFMPDSIAAQVAREITRNLGPNDWILEAGMGTGRVGRALLRQHPRTVGVDISEAMLGYLRAAYGAGAASLPLALADAQALPFPDSTFEAVVAVHVLHLIPQWERALREMRRVLRTEGKLILGLEDRTTTAVRDYFFTCAARHNALPTSGSGAHSAEVIAALRNEGVSVEERRLSSLQWTQSVSAAQTLENIERRTYSILWQMSDETLSALLTETRAWAARRYGTRDMRRVVETIEFQMVLFFVG